MTAGALRGVTRNVIALGFVSFFTDISSELLVYLIPLYLANVLAASPEIIGVIEGLVDSASAFLRLASGASSDRLGRRRLLVGVGYGTSVVSKALYLLASSWPIVLVARLGDRVGKGIRTAPRDALIAESTDPAFRGRAFGVQRAMDTAGAVVGVAVAAIVVAVIQGDASRLADDTFRALVVLALVPGVLAVVVIAIGVTDVPPGPRAGGSRASGASGDAVPGESGPSATPGAADGRSPVATTSPAPAAGGPGTGWSARAARYGSTFWVFIGATALFTLGNSSDAFVSLRSQQLGVTVRDLLLMVIAFNLTNTIIAGPAGALSDRVGRRALILTAWILYAASYAGFAIVAVALPVAALWILYGAYYGVIEAAGRALIADLAPPDARGTAYGIYNTVVGLMLLPASVVAGVLWDSAGPASPFWFGAVCAAVAAFLLAAFVRGGHEAGVRRPRPT